MFPAQRLGQHSSPLHVSALFFEADIFAHQCAHAEPPAPPARAAKVSSSDTNESPSARFGRPRALTRRTAKTSSFELFALPNLIKIAKKNTDNRKTPDASPPQRVFCARQADTSRQPRAASGAARHAQRPRNTLVRRYDNII